jgi:hypothetical protein
MKTILITVILLLVHLSHAQVDADTLNQGLPSKVVKMITKVDNNEVYLRWAPQSADLWLMGSMSGYRILRRQASTLDMLHQEPFAEMAFIKPLDKDTWIAEAEIRPEDANYNIGLQTIHGGWESDYEEGDIFSMIDRNDELQNKYAFSLLACDFDFETAVASGLGYKDTLIDTLSWVEYNIIPVIDENIELSVTIGTAVLNTKYTKTYPNIEVRAEEGEGAVSLYWDRDYYDIYYSGYWIEVSEDNKSYSRIENVPYIHPIENDSTVITPFINYNHDVDNYQPLYYRVIGIDAFGEEHISKTVVKAMGRDRTPPNSPAKVKAKFTTETQIRVSWEEAELVSDHDGFLVFKGYNYKGPWHPISPRLTKNKTEFIDTDASNIMNNYYLVTALDTSGNDASSNAAYASINDTIPPSIPTGLEGRVDSLGNVTLTWDRNRESDIWGYKVQFANDSLHEFSMITGHAVSDTFFRDKIALNTTTPHVFYKIFAVDLRFNYSEQTEMIKVMRPDTIPPVQPIFTGYNVVKDTLTILWKSSNSKDADMQELWRSIDGTNWVLLAGLDRDIEMYQDLNIPENGGYYYKVIAYDINGLSSVSPSYIYLEAVRSVMADGIPRLTIENESNMPNLNWKINNSSISKLYLYRSKNGQPFLKYKTIASTDRSFKDMNVIQDSTYSYALKARDKKGKETGFSNIVKWSSSD